MSIIKAFNSAFSLMNKRNWNNIYVAIDIHDTICKSLYDRNQELEFIGKSKMALKQMTLIPYIKLILFSCTHSKDIKKYHHWFNMNDIYFDYFNENPECPNTELADFSKKFYFNVLIDDKAGFCPNVDWELIYNYFKEKRYLNFIKGENNE